MDPYKYLSGGGASLDLPLLVLVSADLSRNSPGLLPTFGGALGVAELVVDDALDVESLRLRLVLDAGHAHLRVHARVGVAAVQLGGGRRLRVVAVGRARHHRRQGQQQRHEEILQKSGRFF